VLLAHTQVKKFDDPTAEESYDKYKPACADKLWDLTHKWADIICFGHFKAQTYETDGGKTKARNEVRRVLCFDQSPLWEAGNRYGLTGELFVGDGAKKAFRSFADAVAKAKSSQQAATGGKSETKPAPANTQPAASPVGAAPAAAEGEQRADPMKGNASTASTPSMSASATSAAPPAAKPAPASAAPKSSPSSLSAPDDDIPKAGAAICEALLKLMHEIEVNWGQIRDGADGKGADIAAASALPKLPIDAKVKDLTAPEALRLKAELDRRVKLKRERAEKRNGAKTDEKVGAAS
jgi:hypothetical protein